MSDLAMTPTNFTALPAPRTTGADWLAAIVRFFTVTSVGATAVDDRRTPRVHAARREQYIENAAMAREMYRL